MFNGIPHVFKNFVVDWCKIIIFLLSFPLATSGFHRLLDSCKKKPKKGVRFCDKILVREYVPGSFPYECIEERYRPLAFHSRKIRKISRLPQLEKWPSDYRSNSSERQDLVEHPREERLDRDLQTRISDSSSLSQICVDKATQKNYEEGADSELALRRSRKRKHESPSGSDCRYEDGGSGCEVHHPSCSGFDRKRNRYNLRSKSSRIPTNTN